MGKALSQIRDRGEGREPSGQLQLEITKEPARAGSDNQLTSGARDGISAESLAGAGQKLD
jgi:hypothetical protein